MHSRQGGPLSATNLRRIARPPRRGFTLIEVMATLAISSVISIGMLSAAAWQTKSYLNKMAEGDASNQARIVLAALEDNAKWCGLGFGHANDAVGQAATGVCRTQTPPPPSDDYSASACSALDNGGRNDRVQFAFITTQHRAYTAPSAPSAGPCGTDILPANALFLHLADYPSSGGNTPYDVLQNAVPTQTWLTQTDGAYIGGACAGSTPPSAATDKLAWPIKTVVTANQCKYILPVQVVPPSGVPVAQLSCVDGYAPGFTLGFPERKEFYTDTDPTTLLPRLMMSQASFSPQPGPGPKEPAVVAVGVTRFEVRYAFDTSSARDHRLYPCASCGADDPYATTFGGPRAWCREARASDQGGACNLSDDKGTALDTAALRNRIIAIHVTFDITSAGQSSSQTRSNGVPANAKVWTYRHLFMLPNMAS